MLIKVDDAPPRRFGPPPDLSQMRLSTGKRHKIRVIGPDGCCRASSKSYSVPPGYGVYSLALDPPTFTPAKVIFYGKGPATAEVKLNIATLSKKHNVRELFNVPMTTLEQSVPFIVSAEGYRDFKGQVTLRAGKIREGTFTLEPLTETP